MVEGEAALAGLEPAQRRHVEVGALGDLPERQAALVPQLAEAAPDAGVHRLAGSLRRVCLHGNSCWHGARPPSSSAHGCDRITTRWITTSPGTASSSAAAPRASAPRWSSAGPDAAPSSSTPVARATASPTASAACSATTAGRPPTCTPPGGPSSRPTRPSRCATGEVVAGARTEAGFVLDLADGRREPARRVLLATGMDYRLPELPGLAERFGRSVFHCPFCHGWEVRERPLGVLDRGETGVLRALLLRAWSRRRDAVRRRARRARRRRTPTGCGPPAWPSTSARSRACAAPATSWRRSCSPTGGERRCEGLLVAGDPAPAVGPGRPARGASPRRRATWRPTPSRSTRCSRPPCPACRPRAT